MKTAEALPAEAQLQSFEKDLPLSRTMCNQPKLKTP